MPDFSTILSIAWLAAAILFAVVEGLTAVALVSIWFSAGALAALVASFILPGNLTAQFVVFLIVSCACFALVRPLTKRHFTPHVKATNAERLIGEEAVVVETVDNLAATGLVKLKGQTWTARASDNTPLTPGTRVTVLRIEGVKVIVKAD